MSLQNLFELIHSRARLIRHVDDWLSTIAPFPGNLSFIPPPPSLSATASAEYRATLKKLKRYCMHMCQEQDRLFKQIQIDDYHAFLMGKSFLVDGIPTTYIQFIKQYIQFADHSRNFFLYFFCFMVMTAPDILAKTCTRLSRKNIFTKHKLTITALPDTDAVPDIFAMRYEPPALHIPAHFLPDLPYFLMTIGGQFNRWVNIPEEVGIFHEYLHFMFDFVARYVPFESAPFPVNAAYRPLSEKKFQRYQERFEAFKEISQKGFVPKGTKADNLFDEFRTIMNRPFEANIGLSENLLRDTLNINRRTSYQVFMAGDVFESICPEINF